HAERLTAARRRIAVGKLSGAVGTYAHCPPSVERYVLRGLGLMPAPAATQVVQRDRHAEVFGALALLAATGEKIAVEIRHLQRTEVLEAEEPFAEGQKGSSAMPHKRNPILSENITGLARLMRSYAAAALENVALWHERDISHSSVERVIGPDAAILCDFLLKRLCMILEGLQIYPDRMLANLHRTGGLIYSGQMLLALTRAGSSRERAYRVVQAHAMRAWKQGGNFAEAIAKDPFVRRRLGSRAIAACFDPRRYTRHVRTIFRRVFG
ncbi:MAG: adenylosuccinate lyase, partial [Deltaproteobacteria bacterium]|nr:adenylosuccinate lyase [Deltaproteobacteria bacterium]